MNMSQKMREIILLVLAAALFLFGLFSFMRNNLLQGQIKSLKDVSKKMETEMDRLRKESDANRDIVQKLDSEKEGLSTSLKNIQKENARLSEGLRKNEASLKELGEEKKYLEEMLINKTREIEAKNKELEDLKRGPGALPTEGAPAPLPGTPDDLVLQIRQKDDEIARLSEQNKILASKMESLFKVTSAKIAEISTARAALEDTVDKARKKIEDEWNTVDLGAITMNPANAGKSIRSLAAGAQDEGRVLVVNPEHGFIVISLGGNDGVKADTRFAVMRNNQPVAFLKVLEIKDMMTACTIEDASKSVKILPDDIVAVQHDKK